MLRCRTPGDLVALVPHLVGFVPTESLVTIGLSGPRPRVGLTVRADLADAAALSGQVVGALVAARMAACALVVLTEAPSGDGHPYADLVATVEADLTARDVEVTEALLARGRSWWSYRCAAACCPPGGSPVDDSSALVTAVASEHAYDGRAVLASRAVLVDSLQPRPPLGAAFARRMQARARAEEQGHEAAVAAWQRALDAWEARPGDPLPADVAALAAALHSVPVRDEVASWGLRRADALLGLLGQLARLVVPPDDAPLCAVLGSVAYARGNGALALIAVQRALATDPTYSLARLLLAAVDGLLPPTQVRETLRVAARPRGRR